MAKHTLSALERLAAQIGPLQSEGMTDRLVQSIKSWVLQGLIAPGEQLPPERELAEILKVSRSSLRQALKALEVMGIVEARQGAGTFLTEAAETILRQPTDLLIPLRGVSFGELFEARRAMEGEAAAAAAIRATEQDLVELDEALDHMQGRLSHPTAYYASDIAFHHTIARISGNNVFMWFNKMVGTVMADAWRTRTQRGDTARTFAEHQAIVQAIQQRDATAAREAMLTHLMLSKFYSHEPVHFELRVFAAVA